MRYDNPSSSYASSLAMIEVVEGIRTSALRSRRTTAFKLFPPPSITARAQVCSNLQIRSGKMAFYSRCAHLFRHLLYIDRRLTTWILQQVVVFFQFLSSNIYTVAVPSTTLAKTHTLPLRLVVTEVLLARRQYQSIRIFTYNKFLVSFE